MGSLKGCVFQAALVVRERDCIGSLKTVLGFAMLFCYVVGVLIFRLPLSDKAA